MIFARALQWFNSLSIDVAIGSVGGAVLISSLTEIEQDPFTLIALGATVWLVYSFDHLQDAYSIKGNARTHRHRVHQKYFIPLVICFVIVGTLSSLFILPKLPMNVLQLGVLLLLMVFLHWIFNKFESNNSTYMGKEFRISIIYVLGIALPAFANGAFHHPAFFPLLVLFLLLASLNLNILSLVENEIDRLQDQSSIMLSIRYTRVSQIIKLLALAYIGVYIYSALFIFEGMDSRLVMGFIFLGTITPYLFHERLIKNDVYRVIGDLSFSFSYLILL